MTINRLPRCVSNTTMYAIVAVLVMAPMMAFAAQRSISEFIAAQGTTSIYFPPVPDYVGWYSTKGPSSIPINFALIDYAGLANTWLKNKLGTRVSGTITEQPVGGGKADVKVTLRTTNALSWASNAATGSLIFGNQAQAVATGAPAALGDVEFHIDFINSALGAPLPDLVDLFNNHLDLINSYSFQSHATGKYCTGTVGGMTVSQAGNINRGFPPHPPFQPAIINFHPPAPNCP